MKKIINGIGAAGFIAALGIVGAVEQGADIALMWWTLPCIALMSVAAWVADYEHIKKYFCDVVVKHRN